MLGQEDHLVNSALIKMARARVGTMGGFDKLGFVPGGDPSGGMGGGGGGGAPPMDPSMGGGGGAPPMDPSMGGGGGGGMSAGGPAPDPMQAIMQKLDQLGSAGGGAAGAGGKGALTPKIDEKAVLLQILKILARIADFLKIPIPASEMVVNQQDLQGLASASSSGQPMPGMDPTAGAGGGGAGAIPPISPMDPMQGAGTPGAVKAGRDRTGVAFDTAGLREVGSLAAAIANVRRMKACN